MMARRDGLFRAAYDKIFEYCNFRLNLNVEKRSVVASLLERNDVLAVLPTGPGKNLIFQLFVIVAEMERKRQHAALAVWLLQSIIDDQISEKWVYLLSSSPFLSFFLSPRRAFSQATFHSTKNSGIFQTVANGTEIPWGSFRKSRELFSFRSRHADH
jgi:hypothetical protein